VAHDRQSRPPSAAGGHTDWPHEPSRYGISESDRAIGHALVAAILINPFAKPVFRERQTPCAEVERKRRMAIARKTAPTTATNTNCGQTTLKPAPR
jgi:hypothetical protein